MGQRPDNAKALYLEAIRDGNAAAAIDKTEQNNSLVRSFLHGVMKNGAVDTLSDYVSTETYIQHNPNMGEGLDGFTNYLADLAAQGHAMRYEEVYNVIGCGNFVAAMSKINLAGSDTAVIDLFRLDDGLIVEHWDVMEEITPRRHLGQQRQVLTRQLLCHCLSMASAPADQPHSPTKDRNEFDRYQGPHIRYRGHDPRLAQRTGRCIHRSR